MLLFLETKNSFTCPTLWSHRYLELLNLGNEEERRKLGDGHKTRRKGEDGGEENRRKAIESEKDKRDREEWGGSHTSHIPLQIP